MGAFYVYFLANRRHGTLYVGVTNNLLRRVWEHRNAVVPGFTRAHHVHKLVYFETHDTIEQARQRERNLKHWSRDWKIALIERHTPDWHDLYDSLGP